MTWASRIVLAVIGAAALITVATFVAPAQDGQDGPEHDYVNFTVANPKATRPFEQITPQAAGIDAAALDRILQRARETKTDALVILQDGRMVGDWRFGKAAQPIEAMSATKSVVSLAIGRLVDTGKLRLEDPVAKFFPQWKGTPKERITVRHLLDHTSGLKADQNTDEIYLSPNIVQLALEAPLASEPGAVFFYNNKATNLLPAIIEKVSGRKLDEFMRDEVFAPLGVTRFSWLRDPAGNPHAQAGLKIDALDLAKIGQVMLDEGAFRGQRILSPAWVREAVRKGDGIRQTGLLWWQLRAPGTILISDETLDAWRKGGADPEFVAKMASIRGRKASGEGGILALLDEAFGAGQGQKAYVTNVIERKLPGIGFEAGPVAGFYAEGYLGQYVAVVPASGLVVVRMIGEGSFKSDADSFSDFLDAALALKPVPPRQ
jgi:CubicO group peptidase (beta-lactamase class C family)